MERAELLGENGKIFTVQGRALNEHAADDLKVLVVGNPANTNCLIAMNSAPDIPRERFTSMMRLDHNRAIAQLAAKLAASRSATSRRWASGATTRRPCTPTCSTRRFDGEQAAAVVDDQAWIENDFLPNVGKRGAAIIEARGASSRRVGGQRRDRPRARLGRRHRRRLGLDGRPIRRLLRHPGGLIMRLPVHLRRRRVLDRRRASSSTSSRARKIDASVAELIGERDTVKEQGLI